MRLRKYRAWNGEKMIFRGLHDKNWYTESCGGKVVQPAHQDDIHYLKIMDFTGLKDKNEVEIYEGDIVVPFSNEKKLNKSIIIYEFNQYRIKGNSLYWNWELSQIEVIGNIHENPELLEK
jgi:hypothetical protein